MKFNKIDIKACCGKQQVILLLASPLEEEHIRALISNGFKQIDSYAKNGMICMENDFSLIMCPIGANRLQVKFKYKQNKDNLKKIDDIVLSI